MTHCLNWMLVHHFLSGILISENSAATLPSWTALHPGAHYNFGTALVRLRQKVVGQGGKQPSHPLRVDEENREA